MKYTKLNLLLIAKSFAKQSFAVKTSKFLHFGLKYCEVPAPCKQGVNFLYYTTFIGIFQAKYIDVRVGVKKN